MDLPIEMPVTPMLAKAVKSLPDADSVPGGLLYEPKWDGFRCIILRDHDEIVLASRSKNPLTRYFPELVAQAARVLPMRCAIDGEIIVRRTDETGERLDWEALSARIHPAQSRITALSKATPAEFVAFDILALHDDNLMGHSFAERREQLASLWQPQPNWHVTQATTDTTRAAQWFDTFEGAGLDGVIAKPLSATYSPGKRIMLKVKHFRTAEAVVIGYRIHASGQGVGSLLLGLYSEDGTLTNVGGIGALTTQRRHELIDELAPLVMRDDHGDVSPAQTARSRFSNAKDSRYVPLRPERVVEVAFDQLEGRRFRHAVTFLRWRPDREPTSCLLTQVERAPAYDLARVFAD